MFFPRGRPEDAGNLVLRNEYPAPVTLGEETYPTVAHAYWALAVADEQQRAAILRAKTPYSAQKIAEESVLRESWPQARTQLLRLKFAQHPDLAATLTTTGATRLIYAEGFSPFWGSYRGEGRNWMGRLLELVRSELAVTGTRL